MPVALGILSRNGQSGKVLIGDSREDGSAATMIFVCEEFPGQSPGALYPLADHEEPKKRGRFPIPRTYTAAPMLDVATKESPDWASFKPFELKIDTTQMPGAMLPFATETFIAKVLETASAGVKSVTIDETNAAKWGFNPALIHKTVSSTVLLDAGVNGAAGVESSWDE
jgi:hypothetical protein